MHLTDDDLILRYYGESDPRETTRIDAHLEGCRACRESWADLTETMRLVDAAPVPEPGAGFERVMWARVQRALPAKTTRWSLRQWAPAMGLAATVLAFVALGFAWRTAMTPDAGAVVSNGAADAGRELRERVLLTALGGHLEQTEMLLVELMNTSADDTDTALALERSAADDLVASGRLYRATAEETGEVQFAQVLEEIETVLVDVARSPKRLDAEALQSLRGRIDNDDLLFKVRAVTNEIRGRQQHQFTVSEGPL